MGTKDCSPHRAARGRPSTAGLILLCSLARLGWARCSGRLGLAVCTHVYVHAEPAACVHWAGLGAAVQKGPSWAKGGRFLCTGHWTWGQLCEGQLSSSGSRCPLDTLGLCGNGLWDSLSWGWDKGWPRSQQGTRTREPPVVWHSDDLDLEKEPLQGWGEESHRGW